MANNELLKQVPCLRTALNYDVDDINIKKLGELRFKYTTANYITNCTANRIVINATGKLVSIATGEGKFVCPVDENDGEHYLVVKEEEGDEATITTTPINFPTNDKKEIDVNLSSKYVHITVDKADTEVSIYNKYAITNILLLDETIFDIDLLQYSDKLTFLYLRGLPYGNLDNLPISSKSRITLQRLLPAENASNDDYDKNLTGNLRKLVENVNSLNIDNFPYLSCKFEGCRKKENNTEIIVEKNWPKNYTGNASFIIKNCKNVTGDIGELRGFNGYGRVSFYGTNVEGKLSDVFDETTCASINSQFANYNEDTKEWEANSSINYGTDVTSTSTDCLYTKIDPDFDNLELPLNHKFLYCENTVVTDNKGNIKNKYSDEDIKAFIEKQRTLQKNIRNALLAEDPTGKGYHAFKLFINGRDISNIYNAIDNNTEHGNIPPVNLSSIESEQSSDDTETNNV